MCLLTNWPRYLLLAAVLFCAKCLGLHAQNALPTYPQKFGKITLEELKMQKYVPDSNAHAVYLQDIGRFELSFDRGSFTIMRRIKILDEAGYDAGSFFFPSYLGVDAPRVQGVTYTLSQDGTIVQTPLEKKDVFKENIVKGVRGTRFTMPNLKPGCIVEYKVEVYATLASGYSWDFQKEEPVLYSEFSLVHPSEVTYHKRYRGYMQNLYRKVGNKKVAAGQYIQPGNETWVMEDIPAFREKEFVIDEGDYKTSMEFQVENIVAVGAGGTYTYFLDWKKFAGEIGKIVYQGNPIRVCNEAKRSVDSLISTQSDTKAKVRTIYDYVKKSINWNGSYSELPRKESNCATLKAKEGNSAEINFMLLSLCRAVGIQAYPVFIGTRGYSRFYPAFPISTQFNNVLVMVETGKDTLFLDASQKEVPFPFLPEESLVERGLLLDDDRFRYIGIPRNQTSSERVQVSAKLDIEGKVDGTFSVSFEGEQANDHRDQLLEKNEQDWAKKTLLEDINNLAIENVTVNKADTLYNRVRVKGKLTGEEYATAAGNEFFLNPVMLLRYDEAAFSEPTRKYPVELYMPKEYSYSLTLALPEGYEAVNLPKSQRLRLEDGSGEIARVVRYEGGTLGYSIKLILRKTLYLVEEYDALRKLHQLSADMNKEQIQIRKKL